MTTTKPTAKYNCESITSVHSRVPNDISHTAFSPRRLCRSAWVGPSRLAVCLQHNSKTNDPKVFKLGVDRREWSWDILEVTLFRDWKVKGQDHIITRSITLHNDTSFQTTIAHHSYSLGGDTDKSNTAWVQVHYSSFSSRAVVHFAYSYQSWDWHKTAYIHYSGDWQWVCTVLTSHIIGHVGKVFPANNLAILLNGYSRV